MSRPRLCSAVLCAAVVLAAPAAAHAAAGPSGACRASDHATALAAGETREIAAELVEVPGYCYVDVPEAEVEAALDILDRAEGQLGSDFFSSVALHSVVADKASQNTARTKTGREVGLLQLHTFVEVPPAGMDREVATLGHAGRGRPKTLEIAGQTVYLFTDPSSRDSRYTYAWLRHGVQGGFDGATRPAMERWLRRYLAAPDLAPGETEPISRWLVPVPGYLFADYASPEVTDEFVTAPFGAVASSLHRVADRDGQIGGLVLAQAPVGTTADSYAGALRGYGSSQPVTVGGVDVRRFRSGELVLYVWVAGGIAGAFLAPDAAAAEAFLAALLTAAR
ncbi:MAG: hypothetical protein FJW95_01865 [Actinobacteria bacterium]|nr:hypothetical protein [Actinomycetota bacterium]